MRAKTRKAPTGKSAPFQRCPTFSAQSIAPRPRRALLRFFCELQASQHIRIVRACFSACRPPKAKVGRSNRLGRASFSHKIKSVTCEAAILAGFAIALAQLASCVRRNAMATIRQKGPEQWHAQTAGRCRLMSNAYLMSARNRSAVPFTARKGTRAPKYHQHSRIPDRREFDWSANRPSAYYDVTVIPRSRMARTAASANHSESKSIVMQQSTPIAFFAASGTCG